MGKEFQVSVCHDLRFWNDLNVGDRQIVRLVGTDMEFAITRHSKSKIEIKIFCGEKSIKALGIKNV
jgi:hypothetical protein